MSKLAIACDISALSSEQRERRSKIAQILFQDDREVREVKNGYVIQYQLETSTWLLITEFVDLERRCCPFLIFKIEMEPEKQIIKFYLTGRDSKGVKEFLKSQRDFAVIR